MKSGFISFIGRPNAGKSTLLNRLVGEKVAIVSDKPQTTRNRILGVRNYPGAQLVILDTPGIHRPLHRMNVRMVDAARDTLSQVAYWAIGGLLSHAPGLCLITNPSVNSYKRLNAGHRAPRHATWARVSQSSLIRVPGWTESEEAEIELRSPDAMANPYLVFASLLTCVLHGIREQIDPPEPLDESFVMYDDAEMGRRGVTRLPATLGEAPRADAPGARGGRG